MLLSTARCRERQTEPFHRGTVRTNFLTTYTLSRVQLVCCLQVLVARGSCRSPRPASTDWRSSPQGCRWSAACLMQPSCGLWRTIVPRGGTACWHRMRAWQHAFECDEDVWRRYLLETTAAQLSKFVERLAHLADPTARLIPSCADVAYFP